MAQKGYLKVAKDKTGKNGPFVSVLILDKVDDKEGHWFNIFDLWWVGGTALNQSPYDIRKYASQTEPTLVVYEYTTSGEFSNVTAIRPDAEKWSPKADAVEETDKHAAEATEAKQPASNATTEGTTGRQLVASAIEDLVDGIGMIISERLDK